MFRASEEFWALENLKRTLMPSEGVASSEDICALQLRSVEVLEQVRRCRVYSSAAFDAKLKLLTYQAAATEFEDTEIFRDLVVLLDERDRWLSEAVRYRRRKSAEEPKSRKISRFNVKNFFSNMAG